jgi:hypothetical protein
MSLKSFHEDVEKEKQTVRDPEPLQNASNQDVGLLAYLKVCLETSQLNKKTVRDPNNLKPAW